MATHHPTHPRPPAVASGPSRAPLAAAVALTAGFAYLAFRLSFESLTALAAEHGVAGDVAWMFAVLVDGGAVVGTVGVIAARRAGRPVAAYWGTVATFAGISLAFNIAHSDRSPIGVAVAVVPPVAQLVATELLVRMLPVADAGPPPAAAVAPSVADATAAAHRAQTAANAAQAALDTAGRTVTDAAHRATNAADVATDAAHRADQAAANLTAAAAPPLALVDLAAAVAAAVTSPPPAVATDTAAPPPLPLAATFTAPPLPTPTPGDTSPPAGPTPAAGAALDDAVAAYRRIETATRRRPTAEALGAALGVRRTRGGEIRREVEQALEVAS